MNVLELPFNNFVGLNDANEEEFLLALPESDNYLNHLKLFTRALSFLWPKQAAVNFC